MFTGRSMKLNAYYNGFNSLFLYSTEPFYKGRNVSCFVNFFVLITP